MNQSVRLNYNEKLIRKAVLAFWFKSMGIYTVVLLPLMCINLVMRVLDGDKSWVVGALGATLLIGIVFTFQFYFVHRRRSLGRLKLMRNPSSLFEAGEDSFKITTDEGVTELSWHVISEVWRFPQFWLIFVSRSQFLTLPLADFDADMQQNLLNRVKANGAKIK